MFVWRRTWLEPSAAGAAFPSKRGSRYALAMTLRATIAALILCAGCRGEAPPPAESPPSPQRDETPEPTPVKPVETEVVEVTSTAEPRAVPAEPLDEGREAEVPPPVAPARDLAAELRRAVGTPVECVRDYRPSTTTRVPVSVQAVVRPSGLVIEPNVRGPGLSRNDAQCLEQRVGDVVLEPLPGGTSETVATSFTLVLEAPEVESYEVAPPPPPPDDVVQALPKKKPIAPSGVPIEGPEADPIEGPDGVPIQGPQGVPIQGPAPVPIESD